MEPRVAAKNAFGSVAMPPAPIWVPSQRPFIWMSRQSRMSANDHVDNAMTPGAVYRSPGICLTAEEKLGKPQLGDLLMKACDQSSPQMLVVLHSTSGRKKEGKRKGRGIFYLIIVNSMSQYKVWVCLHTSMSFCDPNILSEFLGDRT